MNAPASTARPVAAENVERENPGQFDIKPDLYEIARGADALVISTDWDEFKQPDFMKLRETMKSPVIFDGRNLYKRDAMERAGFVYYSVGRAVVNGR